MTTTSPPNWPTLTREERCDIIKPLWDAGQSAGDITFHFIGATRNMIIGLVHRQKWQRAPSVGQANSARKNQERRKATPNPVKAKVRRAALDDEPAMKVEKVDWIHSERPPLAGTVPISMVDLPMREGVLCRFPVVGGYCGVECGEDMYCETHRRFMYSPRREE